MTTCDALYRHNAYDIIRISYMNMTLNPLLLRGSGDDGIWRDVSLCLLQRKIYMCQLITIVAVSQLPSPSKD